MRPGMRWLLVALLACAHLKHSYVGTLCNVIMPPSGLFLDCSNEASQLKRSTRAHRPRVRPGTVDASWRDGDAHNGASHQPRRDALTRCAWSQPLPLTTGWVGATVGPQEWKWLINCV
jgi:hypothetical protein